MKIEIIDYVEGLDKNYIGFYGNTYTVDSYIGGNYIVRGVAIPKTIVKNEINEKELIKQGDHVRITGATISSISENDKPHEHFLRYVGKTGVVGSVSSEYSTINGSSLYYIDFGDDCNWFLQSSLELVEKDNGK